MGLDWHSLNPCETINAPKVKDNKEANLNGFAKIIEHRKKQVEEEMKKPEEQRNNGFIDFWKDATPEKLFEEEKDKYDCNNCPLLEELQGSDSTGSHFLGFVVKSCDFRGKLIGSLDEYIGHLAEEAYEDRDPESMLKYADALEKKLEELREEGELQKEPYEKYSREYDEATKDMPEGMRIVLYGNKLTKEEYESRPHWVERNIRLAIHWLRTLAKHGVSMKTSY